MMSEDEDGEEGGGAARARKPAGAAAARSALGGSGAEDVAILCSWRANFALKQCMPRHALNELAVCRAVSFIRGDSKVKETPRMTLLKEWLDISAKDHLLVPDDAMVALGHLAWEAVGVLTQTALLIKHFSEVTQSTAAWPPYRLRGNPLGNEPSPAPCDPRAVCGNWSYGRHVLSALGPGVGTALMVPMTDAQIMELRSEIEAVDAVSVPGVPGVARWRGFGRSSQSFLLPCHVNEALRSLRKSHPLFSLPGMPCLWG
mmetsp:Transcript_25894/g.64711  ORF Transcript_25894/g.64711 Transcript_25894/m.64711 type:complete len:259 (+) Transcript_25894:3-779(+)